MSTRIYIYVLKDPSTLEVRYVGQTARLDTRLRHHLGSAGRSPLSRKKEWILELKSLNLKPVLEVIEVVHPWQDWQERERFWISHYRQFSNLTNVLEGGVPTTLGFHHSEISKDLMSQAHLGKSKSEDHKRKIGDANRNPSVNTRRKMSDWQKGVPKPESHMEKLWAATRGVPQSAEHVENVRKAMTGGKRSESTKANMRLAWIKRKERQEASSVN